MRRGIYVLALWLLLGWRPAHADDALAREHFDAGVTATEETRWGEAVRLFEASLAESDKPATRFNLILAYHELDRPIEVSRHAMHFLAEPNMSGREEARERAAGLLAGALQKLAVLNIAGLPVDSQLQVDGRAPLLVRDGNIYMLPGVHHLELRIGQKVSETIEISLRAGQELAWPRLGRSSFEGSAETGPRAEPVPTPALPPPASNQVDASSFAVLRTRAAWALGGVGAALAVAAGGCLLLADRRADKLAERGIDGTTKPGYYDAVGRYVHSLDAIMPLAFTGGALMAGAILVGGRIVRRGSLAWSIASVAAGAALLGVGTFVMVREPRPVIATTDELERPSREGGSLLFTAGLPLLTYGIAYPVMRKRKVQVNAGLSTVRFVW